MIDKVVEDKIKKTKEFMELWMKFHNLYKDALQKESILPEDEDAFLQTKSLIARKYQALTELLELSSSEDKTFEVVTQLLSLQGVSALSDVQMQEIEENWHQSYIALNKILGGLENQKEALARVHPISVIWPKIVQAVWKPGLKKVVKTVVIILMAYLVLIKMFHMDQKVRAFLLGLPPVQNFLEALESEE